MIDWTRVAGLREDVGDDGFDEVIELFLEEVDETISRLRAGADQSTLGEDLHFLKGSALGLGFIAFSEQCQTGESLCAAGEAVNVDLPGLLACYDESRQTFLQELPTAFAA